MQAYIQLRLLMATIVRKLKVLQYSLFEILSDTTVTNVSCNGGNDGKVYVTASGGSGVFVNYNWSNGGNSDTIKKLNCRKYFITITDSKAY